MGYNYVGDIIIMYRDILYVSRDIIIIYGDIIVSMQRYNISIGYISVHAWDIDNVGDIK